MNPHANRNATRLWNGFKHSSLQHKLTPLVLLFILVTSCSFFIVIDQPIMNTMLLASLSVNIVVVLSMVLVVRRYIAKPIALIRDAVQRLSQGDINLQIDYSSHDETGMIIGSINDFSKNLYLTSRFAEAIGQGQLQHDFTAAGDHDKLGNSLIQMRDRIMAAADEDKRRNWATEGHAKFGEILRNYQEDVQALADNIISNFTKYMNANQGALFIADDQHQYLDLVGMYA